MEESARKKGVQIFLKHKMTSIVREKHNAGRVLGIITIAGSNPVNIQARKGVIIATGGHTGNVNFRRIFDPRLTEEYQQACSALRPPGRRRRTGRDGHRRVALVDRQPDRR